MLLYSSSNIQLSPVQFKSVSFRLIPFRLFKLEPTTPTPTRTSYRGQNVGR